MTSIFTETDQAESLPNKSRPDPLPQLTAYWEALREGDNIPHRAQISPRGIEAALSSTFLIERVAPNVSRFRIAGMELADFMGMEVRGLPFSAIFGPEARHDVADKLSRVFDDPARLTMELVAERGLGRPALTARMLVLPLLDTQGRIAMALGCMAIEGKVGRSPRRFDVAKATVSRIYQPAPAPLPEKPTGFQPLVLESSKPRAFAEDATPFEAPRAKSAPYLRVVK
ncbi:PAS domain-containing protein [Pseudorhodobacter turbinis]|uniref:PAS domain-containing protein n=1 Tax=Pseudorhodobacter turbinis TaxID=2500533 RepID=A0A4P8EDY6_9RHOB|nr:PAS domain-containing protein [Pseudorhodobacter turbinis]QCO54833.1 PAS domain-containing protein [Pseudorhodobacter turbinis]